MSEFEADEVPAAANDDGGETPEDFAIDADEPTIAEEDDAEVRLPLRINPALDLTPFAKASSSLIANIDLTGLSKRLAAFDVSHLLPDLSKMIIPALDVSRLLPDTSAFSTLGLERAMFDFATLVPKVDLAPFASSINLALPDFSSMMPKLDFGPDFVAMLEGMRRKLPPNWTDAVDFERTIDVIQEDGIPLVWVPRAAVITQVLACDDRPSRLIVLVDALSDVADDCDSVLTEVNHTTLAGQVPLARKAVAALRDGHHESAQALAVVVTETAVAQALGRDYKAVRRQVLFDLDLVPFTQLRLRAALAPIGPFYTAWYASSGDPRPEALSRHVSVHQADQAHYSVGNALVAVMLAASVLRALQELQEIADSAAVDGDELDETA